MTKRKEHEGMPSWSVGAGDKGQHEEGKEVE